MEDNNKRKKFCEQLKNVDYQIKTEELAKEVVFLRQFGLKNTEQDAERNSF